jgi:outer membrane protein OmpA-like peptidoglycan-associated protein
MANKTCILGLMLLVAAGAWAQQQTSLEQHSATQVFGTKIVAKGPTYADVYCGGYISSQAPQVLGHVVAGWNYFNSTLYGTHDYVYLRGTGMELGKTYEILREVKDPNHQRSFPGQMTDISAAGKVYFEMAQVKVLDLRKDIAITQVTFTCDSTVPGDMVVVMPERELPKAHGPMNFDRFAPANGKLTGRIVLAHDFDSLVGKGAKVYLNVGADKGVKTGDWFRVTRDYKTPHATEPDMVAWGTRDMLDDMQQGGQQHRLTAAELELLPRRSLGELVITQVEPKSSTGVVTFALEEMFLGDGVEMFDAPPAVEAAAPQPMPPTITCTANPPTVRVGDVSTINCDAESPDGRALSYTFAADRGALSPNNNTAVLATRDAGPGPINVTATATDDRNLSASANVPVNVEAPPPAPQPTQAGEVAFKTNSAYVDNRAKAMLDQVALRLNQDNTAKAVVIGFADPKESKTLAQRRAANVKTYLVKNKGIDAGRIETRVGTGTGQKAEIWIVPAGATMP